MNDMKAIMGADIFDGSVTHHGCALLFSKGKIDEIVDLHDVPSSAEQVLIDGGILAPGFIDLQVNGGGGVLFNDAPTIEGIKTICQAHAKFGTTSLLPTLITDNLDVTKKAIEAGIQAYKENVFGFLGLHLEGPHLSKMRKGAHDPSLIRIMTDEDMNLLLQARQCLPNLMVTVAMESVTLEQIQTLSKAQIIVSLGHTNCTHSQAVAALKAGASCATHLYNAMSPLTHREPGLVGAAINEGAFNCGLIADGYHVSPAAMSIAINAKTSPGNVFLVTDAMSTIGTDLKQFTLNERMIYRKDGILTLEDGTLAGADLDMMTAVHNIQSMAGVSLEKALQMAALYPAYCMRIDDRFGQINAGSHANIIHIGADNNINNVWINGLMVVPHTSSNLGSMDSKN